jgi:hypothetical protein
VFSPFEHVATALQISFTSVDVPAFALSQKELPGHVTVFCAVVPHKHSSAVFWNRPFSFAHGPVAGGGVGGAGVVLVDKTVSG